MESNAVGFGVIGLGVGRSHCRDINALPGAKLVGVADLSEERGKAAEKEFETKWYADYKELIERDDVDVVVVAVPSAMHLAVGSDVARAGKHVLMEKPIDITVDKGQQLIDICKEEGVQLTVNFHNRFSPNMQRTKTLIQTGGLGRVLFGQTRLKWYRDQPYYDQGGWRGTWDMDGGGALMNQTVHYIDMLQWFLGRAKALIGHYDTLKHDIETEDFGVGIVSFESGAQGTILGTTASNPNIGTEVAVHGTKGTIILRDNKLDFLSIEGVNDPQDYFDSIPLEGPRGAVANMIDVANNIATPWITGEDGLHSVEIITGIYESSRLGRPFSLTTRQPIGSLAAYSQT